MRKGTSNQCPQHKLRLENNMPAFTWDEHFITHIEEVDDQHHHLVDLINRYGSYIASDECSLEMIHELLESLADYAVYHFQEEELLMKQVGICSAHFEQHASDHKVFSEEVKSLKEGLKTADKEYATNILNFLTHWLAFHILGEDQLMACQMALIKQGVAPNDALRQALEKGNDATEPLLNALSGLFRQVSDRNKQLKELNQTLEERVKERTLQLEEANQELEVLAMTDVLTGLPNRRQSLRLFGAYWDEHVQFKTPLSCMMIDADHFKEVNDTHGHDQGDKVLIELSRCLQESIRTDDTVARLGGDEFLVICPNTNEEGASILAENLLSNVNALCVSTGTGHWIGSISVGVATSNSEVKHVEQLLKLADDQVYIAKSRGKNQVAS